MRRVDLFEATMTGWGRLNPSQRDRFFKAGLKAALRLDRLELRAWRTGGLPPTNGWGDLIGNGTIVPMRHCDKKTSPPDASRSAHAAVDRLVMLPHAAEFNLSSC
jgi:hypothetical protein